MHDTVDDINPCTTHKKEYAIILIVEVLKAMQDLYHQQ